MSRISVNSVVGMTTMTAAIICLGAGIFFDETYTIYAGYSSAAGGIIMLINTIIKRPYIGTILAPLMFLSMAIMAIGGISLIFEPLGQLFQHYIDHYQIKLFITYIICYCLAILHLLTGE